MNLLEAIKGRRAVRTYLPRAVDDDAIHELLRAAVQAPTALNAQEWVFAVVQGTAQLRGYSDRAKALLVGQSTPDDKTRAMAERLRNEEFNVFYDASTLIVIGVMQRGTYSEADVWLAAANLMLAAHGIGLGTCPIGLAVPLLNQPSVKRDLNLPEAGAWIAAIIVGYPSSAPAPVSRGEPRIRAWNRGASRPA